MGRREFLAAAAVAAMAARSGRAAGGDERKKAVILGKPDRDNLTAIAEAGFDGVEAGIVTPDAASAAAEIADELGVRIHSVLRGWAKFQSEDQAEVVETARQTVAAIEAAAAYGADAILLVPGRIDVGPMPEAWEFDVQFDDRTGHLIEVVDGDNAPYADYLAAHNAAHDRFQRIIARLAGVAQQHGVVLALENVWNNMYVDPVHYAHFVRSFNSPWVQSYFDIGNHVKYGKPEDWVRALGDTIVKVHVKDFKLNDDGHGGNFVNIRDGSVDYPEVMTALDEVEYDGWFTIEGGDLTLEEHSERLDTILAGE